MLTLHAFATPNSLKPAIALEEVGLPYHLQPLTCARASSAATRSAR
jgi:glutathione S-transferase